MPVMFQDCFLERAGRPSVFFLMRVPSRPLPPQPARDLGTGHPGRARDSAFPASARRNQMRGPGGSVPWPRKGLCSRGRSWTAPRAGLQSCLVFRLGAPERGCCQSREEGYVAGGWGRVRGDRPSCAVRVHTDSFHRPSCRYY